MESSSGCKVSHIKWGQITVTDKDGNTQIFKDAKIWPDGAKLWDWNETGTRHKPGIQISDVNELLEKGLDTIILSKGMQMILETCPETFDFLKEKNIQVIHEPTRVAVDKYNELVDKGIKVGGLFHSTC